MTYRPPLRYLQAVRYQERDTGAGVVAQRKIAKISKLLPVFLSSMSREGLKRLPRACLSTVFVLKLTEANECYHCVPCPRVCLGTARCSRCVPGCGPPQGCPACTPSRSNTRPWRRFPPSRVRASQWPSAPVHDPV